MADTELNWVYAAIGYARGYSNLRGKREVKQIAVVYKHAPLRAASIHRHVSTRTNAPKNNYTHVHMNPPVGPSV